MNFRIARGQIDVAPPTAARSSGLATFARRLRENVPAGIDPRSYAVVVVAAIGLAVTIVATWPLWQHRTAPPNLYVFEPLASVPWGVPLLLAAIVTIVRPRLGGPGVCALLALAVLGDQVRLQPEVVSLAILVAAPLFGGRGRSVARWHLATLWLWAGVHKALSLGWSTGGAGYIAGSLHAPGLRPVVAVLLPVAEIGLGVMAMSRRTWRGAAWGGLALHLGVFVTLAGFARSGAAIAPWNVVLAVVAVLLFARPDPSAPHPATTAIAAALLVFPALFYAGRVDAYLAHNLYTANLPRAAICGPSGDECHPADFDTFPALSVPLPPEARLFRRLFDRDCVTGTALKIFGPATRLTDPPSVSLHPCPPADDVRPRA